MPPENSSSAMTVGYLIEQVAARFEQAGLFYGHGTDNSLDEAAALIFSLMKLPHADAESAYKLDVPAGVQGRALELMQRRIDTREPLAYILNEAWFAGHAFYVDERVLVPRSPVAELIGERFQPWVDPDKVHAVLDVGTGSGCIAIACALAFPTAKLTATDISPDALEVASLNLGRFGLRERVSLMEADLLEGVTGQFDIIISNPPYVPSAEQPELPAEYGHEPELGLFSGADGLDAARNILAAAPELLNPEGILVLEVGAQWQELEQACPELPFTWLEFEHGGEGVALLNATDFS